MRDGKRCTGLPGRCKSPELWPPYRMGWGPRYFVAPGLDAWGYEHYFDLYPMKGEWQHQGVLDCLCGGRCLLECVFLKLMGLVGCKRPSAVAALPHGLGPQVLHSTRAARLGVRALL